MEILDDRRLKAKEIEVKFDLSKTTVFRPLNEQHL